LAATLGSGAIVAKLIALFVSALFWNILTWAFGIPNSSSHCIIGSLIGVACGDAILRHRDLAQGPAVCSTSWPFRTCSE
jgi:phosphate/sulfate permease